MHPVNRSEVLHSELTDVIMPSEADSCPLIQQNPEHARQGDNVICH